MKLRLEIIHGSILDVDTHVIVNAVNSHGLMGGGVAGVIRKAVRIAAEQEAREQAPIPVGMAILTSGGQGLIPRDYSCSDHARAEPTMKNSSKNVAQATLAALQLADSQGFTSLANSGMGHRRRWNSPRRRCSLYAE